MNRKVTKSLKKNSKTTDIIATDTAVINIIGMDVDSEDQLEDATEDVIIIFLRMVLIFPN